MTAGNDRSDPLPVIDAASMGVAPVDAGASVDAGPSEGGGASARDSPASGERWPTQEELRAAEEGRAAGEGRAAEEDRAVEQALALVGRRSLDEPQPSRRPHSVDQPRPADRLGFTDLPRSVDRAQSAGWPLFMEPCPVGSSNSTDRPRPAEERASASPYPSPAGRAHPWREARALAARSGRDVPVRTRRLPLDQALGHVLAEPLVALTDLPSFDTSAMDGWVVTGPGPWAIREVEGSGSEEGDTSPRPSARLSPRPSREQGILAGHHVPAALPDGDAVRIATGARIPADANAVIRSEHARVDESKGLLHATHRVHPGQDIRPRGQECRSGDQLLPAGALVTPAVLGLAAAAGYDELGTVPRPRVDVLVLGDELLTSGLPHDGLIRDALGPMIGPWLRALGAEVSAPQRLDDDAVVLRRALTASDADLIITTGGTASGPVDHVHPVLAEIGAELLVDGVAVRPGHPMLLARLRAEGPNAGPYLVGLPGNPLAAISGLLTLAEPLLRGLAGHAPEAPYWAVVRDEVHGHPHDTRLVPVVHRAGGRDDSARNLGNVGAGSGAEYVVPLHYNGPAMLRGIAAADGLAVIPPGGVRSGTGVEILDLPWASATPWTEGCFT